MHGVGCRIGATVSTYAALFGLQSVLRDCWSQIERMVRDLAADDGPAQSDMETSAASGSDVTTIPASNNSSANNKGDYQSIPSNNSTIESAEAHHIKIQQKIASTSYKLALATSAII